MKSESYVRSGVEEIEEVKSLRVVGGNFSDDIKKRNTSSIVAKLHSELATLFAQGLGMISTHTVNGGSIKDLEESSRDELTSVTIWMPNVSNVTEKIYPKKPKGGILICSKVLRPHRTMYDAVGRIFKMHGNAVIAISVDTSDMYSSAVIYRFTLLDALGNVWVDTIDVKELADSIYKFYDWSQKTKRIGSRSANFSYNINDAYNKEEYNKLKKFCKLNSRVADKVERGDKNRYFGNCSTRCALMFPSVRSTYGDYVFVSRRNSNKRRLSVSDMMLTTMHKGDEAVMYQSDVKPSVDTPIQLQLYDHFPNINYMIHGHAYIKDCPLTGSYYSCGDLREVASAAKCIENKDAGAINLRNHGFLIYAKTIEDMEAYIKQSVFKNKVVGEEFV